MRVFDPGHCYELDQLDEGHDEWRQLLHFVKRVGPGYPGNEAPAHAGTTIQEVLRALIDRLKYVREQSALQQDTLSYGLDFRCIKHLREVLWILEERAARRHGRPWPCVGANAPEIENIPTCEGCGHIGCEERACGR